MQRAISHLTSTLVTFLTLSLSGKFIYLSVAFYSLVDKQTTTAILYNALLLSTYFSRFSCFQRERLKHIQKFNVIIRSFFEAAKLFLF